MRRHFIILACSVVLASLCCAPPLRADTVVLKDGTRVEGDVKRTDTGWTVTSSQGNLTDISADDVQTIEVGGGKPTDATAASNLASLRRSVEVLRSPDQVLERYHRFIDQNKGTPSIDDAKNDMAVWQDRLDRGLIKVGTQWVTPAQKQDMASQSTSIVLQAVDLLKQGRTNEALPVIQQALDADPQNTAALYLRGLTLFGQEQIVAARKAFESVITTLEDHAPSFNNLGVILWKQNQQMGALKFYEQAMIASPVNKVVLDNVAEALAALPDDQRRNPLAVRVYKTFSDQDAQLQAIMAQSSWHRWGATWVDQPTLDKLKAAEQAVNDKIEKIKADIAAANAKIADIDSNIDANNRAMTQMQAEMLTRDSKGNAIQLPLPSSYYTMQSDNQQMTADRAAEEAKIQSLVQDAKTVKQSLPIPQFTGLQRIIGVEGTPLPPTPAAASTTLPSTGPSTLPTTAPAAVPLSAPVLVPLP